MRAIIFTAVSLIASTAHACYCGIAGCSHVQLQLPHVFYSPSLATQVDAILQQRIEALEARLERMEAALHQGEEIPSPPSEQNILDRKCASCHGTQRAAPDGGIYIDSRSALTSEQFAKAFGEVYELRMPIDTEGQQAFMEPGEISEVIRELYLLTQENP